MKSATLGPSTSRVEVTNVSPHGFWLFVGEQELFVSFKEFPWFKDASIRQISHVELPSAHHLYWPDLDCDGDSRAAVDNHLPGPIRAGDDDGLAKLLERDGVGPMRSVIGV